MAPTLGPSPYTALTHDQKGVMSSQRDAAYREVILEPLRKCAFSTPKFGQNEGGLTIYQIDKWGVLSGTMDNGNPLEHTFAFIRDIIGYDLHAFLERKKQILREEVTSLLSSLLRPT